mmetsp:Transcript_13726/g.20206  ORF Transcript_13726/g.20206 Transcript_13726/m.20206 type:complete len:92 (+) Transcript_13726:244-519(+)
MMAEHCTSDKLAVHLGSLLCIPDNAMTLSDVAQVLVELRALWICYVCWVGQCQVTYLLLGLVSFSMVIGPTLLLHPPVSALWPSTYCDLPG